MKSYARNLIGAGLTLVGAHVCLGSELSPTGHATAQDVAAWPHEWKAASDEYLDSLRGGFHAGRGLMVSFGLDRSVTINGELVSKMSFNLPDVAQITAEQAKAVRQTLAGAGIVQNGARNVLDAGSPSELPAKTVIQNSLNDQTIQSLTVLNTTVSSLGLFKAISFQTALKDALLASVRMR